MTNRNAAFPVLCFAIPFLLLHCSGNAPADRKYPFSHLGGAYLGQKEPGNKPELFAPDIVSTGLYERDFAMTPEGDEIYYCTVTGNYTYATILTSRLKNGRWTRPEVAPFAAGTDYITIEPHVSPDGRRFFFMSDRPDPSGTGRTEKNEDIWVMDRTEEGWSEPYNLGPPVNSEHAEYFPSVAKSGTMYFTRRLKDGSDEAIYRSKLVNGRYQTPERLPPAVNAGRMRFNACVDPDERFLVIPVFGLPDSRGATDYYISYRDDHDVWTGPVHMGDLVNSEARTEYSPYITADGKYMFFTTDRVEKPADIHALSVRALKAWHNSPGNGYPDIWWVSTSFIASLIPQGKQVGLPPAGEGNSFP